MTTYQYVSNTRTDEVHLQYPSCGVDHTLCGRDLLDGILGDETDGDDDVTCATCRRAFEANWRKAQKAADKARVFPAADVAPLDAAMVLPGFSTVRTIDQARDEAAQS
jgi:hypothetical protein